MPRKSPPGERHLAAKAGSRSAAGCAPAAPAATEPEVFGDGIRAAITAAPRITAQPTHSAGTRPSTNAWPLVNPPVAENTEDSTAMPITVPSCRTALRCR